MTSEQPLEPTLALGDEFDEGEESDVYEMEGEEEGDSYDPDEDEDEEVDEEADEAEPENMTALLLSKQNGTTKAEDEEEEEEEEEEEDEEYLEEGKGPAENPIDLLSVAGSKRSVDELEGEDVYGDEDEEDDGETVAKKARV